MNIPNKLTPNPLYSPLIPSDLWTYLTQSAMPLNCLSSFFLPISTPIRVRAKSRGYTNSVVAQPAIPPERIEPQKNLFGCVFGSYGLKTLVNDSLNEKLSA